MTALERPVAKKDWAREVGARNGVSASQARQPADQRVEDAGAWQPAVQKLIEFQSLDDDWDGLGARAPSRELLASAIGLAYVFSAKGLHPPQCVVPGVDGSVSFEWQDADGGYTEIEIVRPLYAEVMMIEPGKPAKHWTLPTE